jgi:hypothetical protein
MKKISTESKEGKVSHMSLLFRAFFIVVLALICIFAMPLSAFARFTANVILVPDNFVTSPTYNLNIQVTCDGAAVAVTNGEFTAAAGKEYEINMQYVSGSARTGYCIVMVGSTTYNTAQIGVDTTAIGGRRDSLTFKIVGGSAGKKVKMTPNWSTSARHAEFVETAVNGTYYITEGESISA